MPGAWRMAHGGGCPAALPPPAAAATAAAHPLPAQPHPLQPALPLNALVLQAGEGPARHGNGQERQQGSEEQQRRAERVSAAPLGGGKTGQQPCRFRPCLPDLPSPADQALPAAASEPGGRWLQPGWRRGRRRQQCRRGRRAPQPRLPAAPAGGDGGARQGRAAGAAAGGGPGAEQTPGEGPGQPGWPPAGLPGGAWGAPQPGRVEANGTCSRGPL